MFEERIIKRVPGAIKPNPKESQGYIEDFTTKTKAELLELLERQDKLLANKSFINKLPDKGKRIKSFQERLTCELKKHDSVEEACTLLSNLNLKKINVNDEIEWNGKYSGKNASDDSGESDIDCDPLKIIVSHSSAEKLKKKSRRLKKHESQKEEVDSSNLISVPEEDSSEEVEQKLEDSTVTSDSILTEAHAENLCKRIDTLPEKKKIPFKPYCTTKSGLHPGLHVPKRLGPHWEVTAATPPPPVHGTVKLLSLQESLHLQHEQAAKLKDIQAKHAAEKLAVCSNLKLGSALPSSSTRNEYREVPESYDTNSSSDEEEIEGQNEDDDNRDTIVYTYTD